MRGVRQFAAFGTRYMRVVQSCTGKSLMKTMGSTGGTLRSYKNGGKSEPGTVQYTHPIGVCTFVPAMLAQDLDPLK